MNVNFKKLRLFIYLCFSFCPWPLKKTTKTLIEVVLTFGRVGNFIILIPIS